MAGNKKYPEFYDSMMNLTVEFKSSPARFSARPRRIFIVLICIPVEIET